MNTRLTKNNAKKVADLFAKEPCDECKELTQKGFVLIGVDEAKTTDRKNPCRTGQLWVISHEAAHRIFNGLDTSKGIAFIPKEVAEIIGLE